MTFKCKDGEKERKRDEVRERRWDVGERNLV